MYSQKNEDDILKQLIPKNDGYFVDIGACDAKWISNSRYFAEIGWKVFMLEMNPFNVCNLLKEYHNNNNIEIFCGAIVEQDNDAIINCYLTEGDGISTIFSEWKDKWEVNTNNSNLYKYKNFVTRGLSCEQLAKHLKSKIDVVDIISIDVEGNSSKIALKLVEYLQAKCFIIEHDNEIELLKHKFTKFNYSYVTHNGENIIFKNDSK